MSGAALTAGFADAGREAQAAFRALLDAMARPGSIVTLPMLAEPPPAPLAPAAAAVALALCDADTPVWLDAPLAAGAVPAWLRFHCGCHIVGAAADAAFAFAADAPPAMAALHAGDDLYPDRAATLVMQVPGFAGGTGLRLAGPGIDGAVHVSIDGLAADFVAQRAANRALYPRGVDCILVAGERALCLPRSTSVEVG
jgi:alpha-D-ribose 1-methylphosphonate 5-triphosphate synthase subunit PhnH